MKRWSAGVKITKEMDHKIIGKLIRENKVLFNAHDEHPRLDIFFALFPPALQKWTRVLINLAVIFMLLILLFYGWTLTPLMRQQNRGFFFAPQ